jgi:protein-L-isoaspartate(D-aspartate) O-methyltransferase
MEVMQKLPRRLFVPSCAGADVPDSEAVSLGEHRILPPTDVVGMMLRALHLEGNERVLEIGCGSGYQAALLGALAREVYSIEIDEQLARDATERLARLACSNVHVLHGDASAGWPEHAPYQAIIVGAAASRLPPELIDQLDLGGRLVIPLGDEHTQLVERIRRRVGGLETETLGSCHLDMLVTPHRTPSSFPWTRA